MQEMLIFLGISLVTYFSSGKFFCLFLAAPAVIVGLHFLGWKEIFVGFFSPAFQPGEVFQYLAAFLSVPLTWCFTDLFAQISLNYQLFLL